MQILLEKRQIQWAILDLTKTSLVKKTRKEVSLDSEGGGRGEESLWETIVVEFSSKAIVFRNLAL